MFSEALLPGCGDDLQHASVGEGLQETWSVHTMAHDSSLKKKESLPCDITDDVTLRGISQSQKGNYCPISLTRGH